MQMTGRISPTARDKEIEKFGNEKDVHIMLSSLKTGGVGLNLTMANKCILVDPWWNAAIQDQASNIPELQGLRRVEVWQANNETLGLLPLVPDRANPSGGVC